MVLVVSRGQVTGQRRQGLLPAEATSFVGRATELAGISGLLGTTRMVTVVGPAGVGKTRTSLRAAAEAADQFPDGIWLAELSGIDDPALLVETVGEALGLPKADLTAVSRYLHGRRLLLGRQSRFPPRRYSALAGFVEPGESVEEAVAREVFEEAGVAVRDVSYISSQPWPFPSQLMLGCHAYAQSDGLVVDHSELEEARWFTRAEVIEAMDKKDDSGSFLPPPPQAIAHHMLQWWLNR